MKYRKKPVVIDAEQLSRDNGPRLAEWCHGKWIDLYARGDNGEDISHIAIYTLEGTMRADLGDYIVKGVKGEFYPCKPDIFLATNEPVEHEDRAVGVSDVIEKTNATAQAEFDRVASANSKAVEQMRA